MTELAPITEAVPALDLVSDAVIEVDNDARIIAWNRAAEQIYGWTAAEAVGADVNALLPSMFPGTTVEAVRAKVEGEGGWHGDVVHRDRKGEAHLVNTALTLVTDGDGRVIGKIAVNRDVTHWRAAQAEAEIERTRMEKLVAHSSELIAVVGSDGRLSYASPAVSVLFGIDTQSASPARMADLVHPDDLTAMRVTMAGTPLTPAAPYSTELRLRRADGSWCWVQSELTDMRNEPAVGGVVVNCHDITDRRQADLLVAGEADVLEMISVGVPLAEIVRRMLTLLRHIAPRLVASVHHVGANGELRGLATDQLKPAMREAMERATPEQLFGAWTAEEVAGCGTAALDAVAASCGLRRWMTLPILGGSGEAVATLTVLWSGEAGMAPNELRACRHLRHLAEMAMGRHRLDLELVHRSQRDALTQLYHRAACMELIGLALTRRNRGVAAVFAVGLDHFKNINGGLGHEAGDEVLRAVAELLHVQAGADAIVARAAGDEFLIYVDHLRDEHEAVRRASALRQALSVPFGSESTQFRVTASIGVAVVRAAGNVTVTDLTRDADLAMRRAKSLGRDRTELFDEELRARSELRLALESGLDIALAEEQFEAYYQPVMEIATGTVRGVEALIRWHHPQFGLVSPGDFIGVAEETGAIIGIGRWMIAAACREAATWRAIRPDRPLTVSVNLSALQLKDTELASFLSEVLVATELEPALLCLEITESVLMEDAVASVAALRRLKAVGVRLAVDDFGTGYSSMAYLKRFPVDELKIDQSFVDGLGCEPEDTAIVTAIIGLADALGLAIVAEGVETEVQARELLRLGADQAQGFLWSPPLPTDGIAAALEAPALGPAALDIAPLTDAVAQPPDDIVAVIAHELRTPLTVISGFADAIELLGDDDRGSAVEAIRRNVARMLSVLESFNALRDLDQGSLVLRAERVLLDRLLDEVVRDVAPNLRGHQLVIGPVPSCPIDVDVTRIHQVLANLLTNAAKYSPGGSAISLEATCGPTEATVTVTDEGDGISPELVALAFRKFGRLDRRSRGTGIGLYLARGFARAHGGDLVYRRRAGGGSELRLTLPLPPP